MYIKLSAQMFVLCTFNVLCLSNTAESSLFPHHLQKKVDQKVTIVDEPQKKEKKKSLNHD